MSNNFIDVVNLKFKYNEDNNKKNILNGLNFQIKKGEFVAILGHNGSGKSTLAKLLNAMLLPSDGDIFIKGINTKDEARIYDIRSTVGLVLQNPDNQIVTSIVEEDVAFGPENLGIEPKQIRLRVDEALKAVDMYEYREAATYSLSGGQKQRLAIAGILAMKPECIVLDEPTSMLDPLGRSEVMSAVKKLNKEKGITVVLITHYMNEVINADRVIIMDQGTIVADDTLRKIFSDVEFLKKYKLSVPQSMELVYELKQLGFDLPSNIIHEDECIYVLKDLIEKVRNKL